jgi:hypothetical protein
MKPFNPSYVKGEQHGHFVQSFGHGRRQHQRPVGSGSKKSSGIPVFFIPGRVTEIGYRNNNLLLGIGGEEYDETNS